MDGWHHQQLCRNLDHDAIDGRIGLVRRFIAHTNEYAWSWSPAIVEEFFADLRDELLGRVRTETSLSEPIPPVAWICDVVAEQP